MGFPMAGHLATKGGHELTVYNRTRAKAEAWVGKYKGRVADTPAKAAEGAEIVLSCVGDDPDLREVTLGPNGAFQKMAKGAIFVDHTTASAKVARELAAEAKKRGFGFAVDWMRKDLRICSETAKQNGAQLPITQTIAGFYDEISKMGGGRWDTSSLIRRLRRG